MLEWVFLMALLCIGLGVALYPLRRKKKVFWVLLPVTAVFLLVGYFVWGDGITWQAFQIAEQKKREAKALIHAAGGVDAVIVRLKEHLSKTPKDAKAWFLLGRVYASLGQWQAAHDAYLVAHGLFEDNAEYTLHYAESVWVIRNKQFDAKTRVLLQKLLDKNPNQADALAMLGYDAYARHLNQEAISYWERLLSVIDASSEEASKIRQAIVEAHKAG